MSGVPEMGVDPEADRKRWVGRTMNELVRHRLTGWQAARAWLVARGMYVSAGIICARRDAREEAADIESRRVDRDPCWRCGVRADVGCEHQRWAA